MLERRLQAIEALLNKSSAQRQIGKNANNDAKAHLEKARSLRLQALKAFQAQDYEACATLLDEASATLFEGVRLAEPKQQKQEAERRAFDSRMQSLKALLAAQKRIGSEKHLETRQAATYQKIDSLIQQANARADASKLEEAVATLDQALSLAKTEIVDMRDGDVLVRSLQFSDKKEEFNYEIGRNDFHQQLIVDLDAEKGEAASNNAATRNLLSQAAALRAKAESLAKKGDYETGVKTLEDSTTILIRAIRSMGLAIPG